MNYSFTTLFNHNNEQRIYVPGERQKDFAFKKGEFPLYTGIKKVDMKIICLLFVEVACIVVVTQSQSAGDDDMCAVKGQVRTFGNILIEVCNSNSLTWSSLSLRNGSNICGERSGVCEASQKCDQTETSDAVLATIIIILILSLIGVIAGWVRTCFVAQKMKLRMELSHDPSQLPRLNTYTTLRPAIPNPSSNNNSYSDLPPPLPHATFYSSIGPDYEVLGHRHSHQVEQNTTEQQLTPQNLPQQQGGDHTYQVVDHCTHQKKQPEVISETDSEEEREIEVAQKYEVPVKLHIKKEESEMLTD